MRELIVLALFIAWIAGVVFVKGFWLTVTAICIPFYAWYIVVEKYMQMNGLL